MTRPSAPPPPPPLPGGAGREAQSRESLHEDDEGTVVILDGELELEELSPEPASEAAVPAAPEPPTAPPAEEPYRPVNNRAFGRFELLIEMGRGGMATLYLARIQGPEQFEKLLAIKKIHDHLAPDEQFVRMFMDEARIAAKIHHPNVATIFDMGRIDNAYFIAMEYVHGQNLTDILKASVRDRGRFPWSHAVRMVADAAAGLHAAHELTGPEGRPLNVVHRDVSPQNILISYDGSVKVVDFGIAFAAEKLEHTAAGTLKGKAGYMSPEQAMGELLDRRSDIFSLGIVLWECVCLKRLFREANEGATLLRVRDADVPRPTSVNPELPREIERIIMKALARERDHRYDSMEAFSDDLESLLVSRGEVVGRKQIAGILDDLFHDRRKLKDDQIQQALKEAGQSPVKGVGMSSTGTLSLQLTSTPVTSAGARSWVPWTVAVFMALVTGGVAAMLWLKPFDRGAAAPPALPRVVRVMDAPAGRSAPMRPEAPPAPRLVTLRVMVEPARPDVEIEFRGQRFSGPAFEMRIPPSNNPEIIRIDAPDHAPQTLVLVPNSDNTIPVKLTKMARPRPRPRPRRIHRWRPRRRAMRPGLLDLPE